MALAENIYQLRTSAHLSREKLAEILNVSHQAVQKWENGTSTPDIRNIIKIAKYFGVSMDALLLDCDSRLTEERKSTVEIRPRYANLHEWEDYSGQLGVEYVQSLEEGRDIERYKDLFDAVSKMPAGNLRTRMADVIFDLVQQAGQRPGYAYLEPSALEEIRALRKPFDFRRNEPDEEVLKQKIHGAWLGRVCGCLLGKSVEGIRTHELHPLLKETGNYPMHRYIRAADITDEIAQKYQFPLRSRPYADTIDCMPSDDDTNYTVLAQEIVSKYGRDFTAHDVARAWMDSQPKKAYCSAERVAYCNFVKAYAPPESAVYKNPYREWIGAQIRGDYFGYINPGDPETAAEMAFRDASISHVKNGIYGEMWAAAMIACAAVTDEPEDIILGGLAQIPASSRLYEAVMGVVQGHLEGVSQAECFRRIHEAYDEYTGHGWCHTISNAMIVAAALLYGGGDYGKSICMAVETGFDTDCNGATVGSVLGMRGGVEAIGPEWSEPVHGLLATSIVGVGTVSIARRAELTMKHLK